MSDDSSRPSIPNPTECFCCEQPVEWPHGFPDGAVVFTSGGNYGSRTFDPMHEQAAIVICDECVRNRGEAMVIRIALPQPTEWKLVGNWHDYIGTPA